MLGWLLDRAARRPRATLGLLALLTLAGVLILALAPVDGRLDRLAPSGSAADRAGQLERESFGTDTTLVVLRGDMLKTLRDDGDITRLAGLEGCLMGAVPKSVKQGPCAKMRDLDSVQSVIGPAGFANAALVQLQEQARAKLSGATANADALREQAEAEAKEKGLSKQQIQQAGDLAAQLAQGKSLGELLQFVEDSGLGADLLTAELSSDPFITALFFARGKDAKGKLGPKRRVAWMLPNRETGLIQVRLKPDLSVRQRAATTEAMRELLSDPTFRLSGTDAELEFTGLAPASQTLSEAIRRSTGALALGAVLVMAVVLALARRLRRRLLPLLVAGSVVGAAMLALLLVTGALSLATVIALPILVGLAVDQAVQAQLRLERRLHPKALRSLVIAGTAAAASALALAASPFAIVRTVAVILAAAVLLAILAAAAASAASLRLKERRTIPALADADDLIAGSPPVRGAAGAAHVLTEHVAGMGRRAAWGVLAAGIALAVAGAVAGSHAKVDTDLEQLVPAGSATAKQLERLQAQTGTASTVSLVAKTKNVGDPALWRYLVAAQRAATKGTDGRCEDVDGGLCTPLSLDDLFGTSPKGKLPTDEQIEQTLSVLPPALQQAIVDPQRGVVAIPFGIASLDGTRQRQAAAQLRALTAGAPSGVEAGVSGLPAVVEAGASALESPGRRAVLAALAILLPALVLLVLLRAPRRVAVAVLPAALALGWSELAIWLFGVPRTPLTAALGVLVCAVAIEFSVLLSERYVALRKVGVQQERAITATLRDTGGGVVISAGATIAGFAVLGLASIPLLAEFGLATALDLLLVLLALVLVAPAAWIVADRGDAPTR